MLPETLTMKISVRLFDSWGLCILVCFLPSFILLMFTLHPTVLVNYNASVNVKVIHCPMLLNVQLDQFSSQLLVTPFDSIPPLAVTLPC